MTLTVSPYGIASFLCFAVLYGNYFDGINPASVAGYARWYVLASFWLNFLVLFLLAALTASGIKLASRRKPVVGQAIVAGLATLATIWLYIDTKVYGLFHLHISRFFIEALLQKDAVNQIGVSPAALLVSAWPLLIFLAPHLLIKKLSAYPLAEVGHRRLAVALVAIVALLGVDKAAYGLFYFKGYPFVFELKNAPPVYPTPHPYHVSIVFERLLGANSRTNFTDQIGNRLGEAVATAGRFSYPREPLPDTALRRPLNIVVVIAESLRAMDFNVRTAPFLTSLSGSMIDARQHYSSSNCTHLGLFSLFYGLNPHYFHDARVGQVPSAPMALLSQNGYDIHATVSQTMEWYDMDRFLFGGRQQTYEPQHKSRIERDRAVTDRSIELARKYQGSNKRYLNFVYYYATHADYQHPPETTVFEPELKGAINFASSDLRERSEPLLNRYRNSIRFIDAEVQRLVVGLKEAGAWEDTILVFTGDHGEEFFEEGRFGHNSSLNRFQTHVPLLIHIPGLEPRRIEWVTSHMDVIGTLLDALKVPEGFLVNVQGRNMLIDSHGPIYIGQAHYQRPERYAIVDSEKKLEIDLQGNSLRMESATDLQGRPIGIPAQAQQEVLGLLQQFKAFRN